MDRDRSLTNRGCDSLDVAGADIANCEHSRKARFQHFSRAGEWPVELRNLSSGKIQVAASENEPLAVHGDTALQPFRPRRCACHHKQMSDVMSRSFACSSIDPIDPLQLPLAMESNDLSIEMQFNL